ncbi:hypothetical protein DFH06DRAFT_1349053 [Mycena polygramma]|nr:hypothetical protein DFH06DRAFT_1349053 [Mycena polygramma]
MSPDAATQVSFEHAIDDLSLTVGYCSRRMMTEMVINSDDNQIASSLAAWEAFDDETRPDALRVLAFALVLRQQRITVELHDEFKKLCEKARQNNSLQVYKQKEDARRALARSHNLPPGVPEDCPVVLVDGIIEVLPLEGDESDETDDSQTPRTYEENDSDEENKPPLTLSEIDQDETDGHSIVQEDSDGHSSDGDSTSAVQSHEDAAAAANSLDEDAATAADSLDALAALPSPLVTPGLLPSPDLPSPTSPTYNSHAQPKRCREFDRACRYAYGPARLEGQTEGEGVEPAWQHLRRDPADEYEFRQGFARGLARAWEMALAPPSSPELGDERPEHVHEEWSSLSQLLAPGRGQPSPSELSSGDLTLQEIQEVEDAWVRVLRAAQRENEEQNEVANLLLDDGKHVFSLMNALRRATLS